MNESFRAVKISERVHWVGAIDYGIRDFHGYNITRGTTYNAFLISGSKPILIDTVKEEFFDEMVARISSVMNPRDISYIISNHAEMDHSGALLRAVNLIQPEQVLASTMGVVALKAHFHNQIVVTEVNHNEPFVLGDANFKCIESRMLHWPDSMFTYFANDQVLFSQDSFGMHLATSKLFSDQNDRHILRHEAMKYFANILLPYANFVTRLLEMWPTFELDIKMLAPDHGPIWRGAGDIVWIMNLWHSWAKRENTDRVIVCYDTMWGSTARMAAAIADGIMESQLPVKVMPLSNCHRSEIVAELLEAGALIIGSPTINNQMFPTVADLLCYIRGLKVKNLIGQVFGSFGWSGEAVDNIRNELTQMQIRFVNAPVKMRYVPDAECLAHCRDVGLKIAGAMRSKE